MSQRSSPATRSPSSFAVPPASSSATRRAGWSSRSAQGGVEGYGPAEIRRLWTIVSFQRDLGINLAGVEAILKLRDHLADVHRRLDDARRATSARPWTRPTRRSRRRCLNLKPAEAELRRLLERPDARPAGQAGRREPARRRRRRRSACSAS